LTIYEIVVIAAGKDVALTARW